MSAPSPSKALTYASYLKIDELLQLQQPRSEGPEHDEMLFIIIHQVYELWFKQLLHEADRLIEVLRENDQSSSCATLERMRTILKTMVAQIDILETMTPVSFNSFRDRLESASGFQSYQFREMEFLLGKKRAGMVEHHEHDETVQQKLQQRYEQPTIYDAFLQFLVGVGYEVPPNPLHRDVTQPLETMPNMHPILIDVYHNDPAVRQVCELMVDFDEGFQEWRYRHVKMVERTIGFKTGTGGSAGAEYLRRTLFQPVFPDLWAIRSEL